MKLFFYYATRTVKNQIRKLLKTWVAVFLAVCFLFGIVLGLGGAFLSELAGDEMPEEDVTEEEIVEPEEPELPPDPALVRQVVEAVAGGIFLLLITLNILSAGKSGTRIFTMADVNLLFAAPMKPQSVLLFRLCTQLGTIIFAGLYLFFQLPSFLEMGVTVGQFFVGVLVLILMLCYAKLINILLFTLASTHRTAERLITPLGYGLPLLVAGGFALYFRTSGLAPLDAILRFANAPLTRYLPVFGWVKSFLAAALDGALVMALIWLAVSLAGIVLLAVWIWHLRADFYEDALQQSSETAEALNNMQNEGGIVKRKKKDRGDSIRRDGLCRGAGSTVLLTKNLYNRTRFALLGVFTKTSITYLVVSVGVSLLLRLVVHTDTLIPVALAIGGLAFFRSLGNPIANELSRVTFQMMPESPFRKIWMCLLSGSLDCLLDMVPAFLAACLILGANPLAALGWMLFILSVDLYSSAVGAFIDLSLSVGLNKSIRSVIQIMFIYFGLLPDVILLVVGGIFGLLPLFAVIAAAVNLLIGFGMGSLCPLFLLNGRR